MRRKNIIIILVLLWCYTVSVWADHIDWTCDPHSYQYDMTVYAGLQVDGTDVQDLSRYTVAAFSGSECRGVMEVKTIDDYSYGYLRIRSNESEGDSIIFRVFDSQTGKIAKCSNMIIFSDLEVFGKPSSPLLIEAFNPYKITFSADGQILDSFFYFNDTITSPEAPEKEGYTFVEWQNVPETMPAHDLEINGLYKVNTYAVVYYVDGEIYRTDSIAYGETIPVAPAPVKEGYKFSGWSDVPVSMPSHDIRIDGRFDKITGITDPMTHEDTLVTVYTINGIRIGRNMPYQEIRQKWPAGLYVVNGKKIVVR